MKQKVVFKGFLLALIVSFSSCSMNEPTLSSTPATDFDSRAKSTRRSNPTRTNAQGTPQRYLDSLPSIIVRTFNIPFGRSVNDKGILQTHLLDIYQLYGDTLAARPVIVVVHGGNLTGGDKGHMATFANEYAKRGYLAVLVNYRLSTLPHKNHITDPVFVAAVEDAKEDVFGAIRWLRANAAQWRIDKGRIGIMGYSAGATIAFSVNFGQETQQQENDADLSQSTAISTIVEAAGLTDTTFINPGEKPVLMIHGLHDTGIKNEHVLTIYQNCRAKRVPVALKYTPGGHDMAPFIREIGAGSSEWFKALLVDAKPVY